ncbi:MAG: Uma2 family endonuclease [Armatimonadota bacterium]
MTGASERPKRRLTSADLARLPEGRCRYELIDGELREYPWGDALHGMVGARLGAAASVFVEERNLGRTFLAGTGFWIREDPDTVLAPDWAFVPYHQRPGKPSNDFVRTVPALVLEVQAQLETRGEAAAKVGRWLAAGAPVVWDCDPSRKLVLVHRADKETVMLGVADTLDGGEILPEFALPLGAVFR